MLLHEFYFSAVKSFKRDFENNPKEIVEKLGKLNVEDIQMLLSRDFPPSDVLGKSLNNAHFFMASQFEKYPNTYLITPDLQKNLELVREPLLIQDIDLPDMSFILYPDITYAELGYPQFDNIYRVECVHWRIHKTSKYTEFRLCIISTNVKEEERGDYAPLENCPYRFFRFGADTPYLPELLEAFQPEEVQHRTYVGDNPFLDTQQYWEAKNKLEQFLFNQLFSVSMYLKEGGTLVSNTDDPTNIIKMIG